MHCANGSDGMENKTDAIPTLMEDTSNKKGGNWSWRVYGRDLKRMSAKL